MRALRRDLHQSGEDFPELLEELRSYLGVINADVLNEFPTQFQSENITASIDDVSGCFGLRRSEYFRPWSASNNLFSLSHFARQTTD